MLINLVEVPGPVETAHNFGHAIRPGQHEGSGQPKHLGLEPRDDHGQVDEGTVVKALRVVVVHHCDRFTRLQHSPAWA